ncbi:hypothetical protein ACTFIV_003350 [Dictyostelium citrinum]
MEIIYINKSSDIFNFLQDSEFYKLIIDLRTKDQYEKSHIKSSINLPPPKKDHNDDLKKEVDKIISDFQLSSKSKFKTKKIVLYSSSEFKIYDNIQNNNHNNTDSKKDCWENNVLNYLINNNNIFINNNNKKEIKLLIYQNGFNQFQTLYPFMCNNKILYPTEIIENFLYLGNKENSEIKEQIDNLKITHILNLAQEITDSFPNDYKYYDGCKWIDSKREFILDDFKQVIKFINDAKDINGRVLVHCAKGISRSSTAVIAYFINEFKISTIEAYNKIKSKRSIIEPNYNYYYQLDQFYKNLKEQEECIIKN